MQYLAIELPWLESDKQIYSQHKNFLIRSTSNICLAFCGWLYHYEMVQYISDGKHRLGLTLCMCLFWYVLYSRHFHISYLNGIWNLKADFGHVMTFQNKIYEDVQSFPVQSVWQPTFWSTHECHFFHLPHCTVA